MGTLTMKFGGSSVGTTSALTQVISIVLQEHERWDRLIVIVSALEGVTDALIEAAHLAQLSNRRGYRRIVATIRTRHLALIEQLPFGPNEHNALQADIDKLLFDMLDICQNIADPAVDTVEPETIDAIIGVGERLSARIVAALLRQNGLRGVAIDATELIITDDTFGNAAPDVQETQRRIQQDLMPMLGRKIIPVITGFIAGTPNGKPTTLGRGGSDYTASIVGVCTESDEVWMWTNVDGMMSTDPREVETAQVIPVLSYDEVAELAYFGARILHSRMIGLLRAQGIPLRIKNIFKPQQVGTLVHNLGDAKSPHRFKAVTAIQGIALRAHHNGPLSEITRLVSITMYETTGDHADVMITSQSATQSIITFVIPTTAGPDAVHHMQTSLLREIRTHTQLAEWKPVPVSIITVIGTDIDLYPSLIAKIFSTLDDIPILSISQGASHCSVSIVIEPAYTETAIARIHAMVIQ